MPSSSSRSPPPRCPRRADPPTADRALRRRPALRRGACSSPAEPRERDPATGLDTDNRMLFEIRVVGDQWFLDSFNQSGTESRALMNRAALHPLGRWYHVASVYDGREFRNYVNGVQEGGAEIRLAPHSPGHASVGMRINRVFYFKGAVHAARFTRRALAPGEFLPPPVNR